MKGFFASTYAILLSLRKRKRDIVSAYNRIEKIKHPLFLLKNETIEKDTHGPIFKGLRFLMPSLMKKF